VAALLKEAPLPLGLADDPYVRTLEASPALSVVREIRRWWRGFSLEECCVLTTVALKQRGLFGAAVNGFSDKDVSPYLGRLARSFLAEMSQSSDGFVASVAAFELSLLQIRREGSLEEFVVHWDCEPYGVIQGLLSRDGQREEPAPGSYRMRVNGRLPGFFTVECLEERCGTRALTG
jgi:hypothetical protein